MTVRTNRLKIDFNIDAIERDFAFIRFQRQSKGGWHGAQRLDRLIGDDYKAYAVLFQYGQFAYAMFKRPVDTYELLSRIRSDGEFSQDAAIEVRPRVCRTEADDCICEAWLAQILINSLASSRSRYEQYHYCNLTGAFLVVPDLNGKNKDIIDAFEVTLDKNYLLNVSVVRHRKLISVFRDIKSGGLDSEKIRNKPRYVLHEGTGTLRRWLLREGEPDPQRVYIQKKFGNKRAHAPFIEFKSRMAYEGSRAGIFHYVLDSIQEHLSEYMSVKLQDLKKPHTVELTETILKKPEYLRSRLEGQPIHIVDTIGSEESQDLVRLLRKVLFSYIEDRKLLTTGRRDKKGALNIRVIHDAAYYAENDTGDDYVASNVETLRQHITIENEAAVSNTVVKTCVKELLIKRDIKEQNLSLYDWSKLNATQKWTFAAYVKQDKYIVFMDIYPDGHFSFRKVDPNTLPWYEEYQEYVTLLTEVKGDEWQTHLSLEGLVISENGDENLIYSTEEITIPDLKEIRSIIREVDAELPEGLRTGYDLAAAVEQCFTETPESGNERVCQLKEFLNTIGQQEISKREFKNSLNTCLGKNSKINNYLRDSLYKKHGMRLNFPKTKDSLNYLFDASLNIRYFKKNDTEAYYFVGDRRDNIKVSFNNACHLRKVEAVNGSKLVFQEILRTMDVDFVRTGQSTVLPFPFKYIREYVQFEK